MFIFLHTFSVDNYLSQRILQKLGLLVLDVYVNSLLVQRLQTFPLYYRHNLIIISGVRLLFKGKIYGNNSRFFINEIGRSNSNSALQCVMDKRKCCRRYRFGEWYFPNGVQVPIEGYATVLPGIGLTMELSIWIVLMISCHQLDNTVVGCLIVPLSSDFMCLHR